MNIKRILIIGGDTRIEYLAQGLVEEGYEVSQVESLWESIES